MLTLQLDGGSRPTLVYPKPDHVPATYTILNFPVVDIEAGRRRAGRPRASSSTKYPGTDDPRGINRHGGPLIAWFTDPAGNILSVLEG